ncbi:MAG: ribonuclease D [Acidobacteriota bacterium]
MKWIDEQASLETALKVIARSPQIAVDTEADSLHSYFDKVCLIQISDDRDDYIVDPLGKIELSSFGQILADSSRTKIFHGADYDLRILQRDFGFRVVNLVDTMICAQLAGYEAVGLAALLKRHFDLDVDKSHQRADWAMRPLSEKMILYAALDTHYLIELAGIMREQLLSLGRWEWALEEFSRLEQIRFRESEPADEGWRKIKGLAKLERVNLAVLSRLHQWRDERARELDRPPFKVIGNEAMMEIARTLPATREELARIKGVSGYHMARNGAEILTRVREAAASPQSSWPEKSQPKEWIRDRALEKRTEKLKKVRDRIAAELKIDASILAPRHVLTAIASMQPADSDELSSIPALRQWQREVAGSSFVDALKET